MSNDNNTMTVEEQMQAEIARLQAENAELKSKTPPGGGLGFKVSQKGGVSVYGLGRFPVTLYASQWSRLLEKKDEILTFIEANQASLKTKEDAKDTPPAADASTES